MKDSKKVIVVGGGIAGLITATSLAKKNIDVLLIEKNDKCGGLVNSFERNGFLFDGGIRAIENAGMIMPMLEELDIKLHFFNSKISLGVEDDVIHVETKESIDEYEKQLKRMYPESGEDVDRIIAIIKRMEEHMNVLFGKDSPFFKDKDRDNSYFIKSFIPWLFKLAGTFFAIVKMKKPVEEFLAGAVKNRSLNDIISQHFFKKTPAFFAMSYFALYTDYYYPQGGVGQVPLRIKEKLVGLGGEVLTNTEIFHVDPYKKVIRDREGNQYEFEKLIWAADLKQLYKIIRIDDFPPKISEKIKIERDNILSKKGAESVFTVFMGVGQDPQKFRDISHGHFFYTPSREGLGDTQRDELSRMLNNWSSFSKEEVKDWIDRFCRLNTFEISIPALNDKETAPPGKTGVIASLLLDYAFVICVKNDGWYEEFVQYMEKKIIEVLDQSIYPGLKEDLIFSFSANPLTIENSVGSSEGSIVGWSFEEPVPINSSMLNMKDSVRTSMADVFKVGQWAASPAGLPTCILTAKLAADLVGKEFSKAHK